MTAQAWIERFALQPHPEGGWYRELHRSVVEVQRLDDRQPRCGLTLIVFLLQAGECSRWHRVIGADEIWSYAAGAPLELWRLPPTGGRQERLTLGPFDAADPDQSPLQMVAANWWQAARSLGAWSLVHCSVGPGFAFEDFSLLADVGAADQPAGADPRFL